MPPSAAKQGVPLVLVCGEDDFAVHQRAREIFQQWSKELGGSDHELIDGRVPNSCEALRVIHRVREALQTLPFFGTAKAVWLQNCNFLGEERTATAASVTESLADLAQELKAFSWDNVRLLISAGKVDKRKVFFKAVDKVGSVENLAGLSMDDRDWTDRATTMARSMLANARKEISEEALSELITRVGPNTRQLNSEVEKLVLYVGDNPRIEMADVEAVSIRNKAARAFALGDALGDRDLPRLLQRLDEELWEVKLDPRKSEIGLLYGLISKMRALLLLKEMVREGWIKPDAQYPRFKAQLERVPQDKLPEDRRFNPLAQNPYVLYKALSQVNRYSEAELIRAMELLLQCNRRLVSSGLDESLVLQQTLVQIIRHEEALPGAKTQPVGAV